MEIILEPGYQAAFGAEDVSSPAMRRAIGEWFRAYYDVGVPQGRDPCLQIPYIIVRKLTRAIFSEYSCPGWERVPAREAMEQGLIGGECYLKPVTEGGEVRWAVVPRSSILVFGRSWDGEPTDVGLSQRVLENGRYYTLLERRRLDEGGYLTIHNRLFRSQSPQSLGREVRLGEAAFSRQLPHRFTYPQAMGSVGLARLKMPMVNCIDGGPEGVSVYAPALGLIDAINENEAQLRGEFRKGQSRLVVSADMLRSGELEDELFVGLDESPENVGITVFAPALREQAYLNRQQAYLRCVENVIGLKRGLLSAVEAVDRTATEITSSEGEYMAALVEFRRAWEACLRRAGGILTALGLEAPEVNIDWGDGVIE